MDLKNTGINIERIFGSDDDTKFQLEPCKPKVIKICIADVIKYNLGKQPEFYHFDNKTQKIYIVKPIKKRI